MMTLGSNCSWLIRLILTRVRLPLGLSLRLNRTSSMVLANVGSHHPILEC
jgi:hypothetical protein